MYGVQRIMVLLLLLHQSRRSIVTNGLSYCWKSHVWPVTMTANNKNAMAAAVRFFPSQTRASKKGHILPKRQPKKEKDPSAPPRQRGLQFNKSRFNLPDEVESAIDRVIGDINIEDYKEQPPPVPFGPDLPNRVQFGHANSTPDQLERQSYIIKYNRKNWQRMVDKYRSEYHHYGLVNLSSTLGYLSKVTTIPSSPHNRELLLKMLDQTAHCIDTCNINARIYGSIVEAIVNLKALPTTRRERMDVNFPQSSGAVRIISHLADPVFCRDFLHTKFDTHAIGDVCWSLAELDRYDLMQLLINEMDEEMLTKFLTVPDERGKMMHLAKFLYACGTLQVHSPALLAAMDAHADVLVQHGTPEAISFAAWACGKWRYPAIPLFTAIEARAHWLVHEKGNPGHLSNIVWAVAALGHGELTPQLFENMAGRFEWMRSRSTYREFQIIQRSFTMTGRSLEEAEALAATTKARTADGDDDYDDADDDDDDDRYLLRGPWKKKMHRPSRKHF
jgi:hypothetical protein